MTACKVHLFGLKPCDISSCSNHRLLSDSALQRYHSWISTTQSKFHLENKKENCSLLSVNLNVIIKPMTTATSSVRKKRFIDRAFFF